MTGYTCVMHSCMSNPTDIQRHSQLWIYNRVELMTDSTVPIVVSHILFLLNLRPICLEPITTGKPFAKKISLTVCVWKFMHIGWREQVESKKSKK